MDQHDYHPGNLLLSFYTELQRDDVLLGRGTGPNDFEGNIRFRRLVAEVARVSDPIELTASKGTLAQKVVDTVKRRGGRFVRKLSKAEATALLKSRQQQQPGARNKDGNSGRPSSSSSSSKRTRLPKGQDVYVEVPLSVAVEKAKQSFRHQKRIRDSRGGNSSGASASASAQGLEEDHDCVMGANTTAAPLGAGTAALFDRLNQDPHFLVGDTDTEDPNNSRIRPTAAATIDQHIRRLSGLRAGTTTTTSNAGGPGGVQGGHYYQTEDEQKPQAQERGGVATAVLGAGGAGGAGAGNMLLAHHQQQEHHHQQQEHHHHDQEQARVVLAPAGATGPRQEALRAQPNIQDPSMYVAPPQATPQLPPSFLPNNNLVLNWRPGAGVGAPPPPPPPSLLSIYDHLYAWPPRQHHHQHHHQYPPAQSQNDHATNLLLSRLLASPAALIPPQQQTPAAGARFLEQDVSRALSLELSRRRDLASLLFPGGGAAAGAGQPPPPPPQEQSQLPPTVVFPPTPVALPLPHQQGGDQGVAQPSAALLSALLATNAALASSVSGTLNALSPALQQHLLLAASQQQQEQQLHQQLQQLNGQQVVAGDAPRPSGVLPHQVTSSSEDNPPTASNNNINSNHNSGNENHNGSPNENHNGSPNENHNGSPTEANDHGGQPGVTTTSSTTTNGVGTNHHSWPSSEQLGLGLGLEARGGGRGRGGAALAAVSAAAVSGAAAGRGDDQAATSSAYNAEQQANDWLNFLLNRSRGQG
jgi:hypothetical protein